MIFNNCFTILSHPTSYYLVKVALLMIQLPLFLSPLLISKKNLWWVEWNTYRNLTLTRNLSRAMD